MEKITDLCTGCRACEQLCAHHAISMVEDKEGFLTSSINQEQCVDCGLCVARCPQNTPVDTKYSQRVFAIRLKDDELLYRSASGGAFAGIAKAWINEGGVVFGVVYDKEWNAHHVCASTLDELSPILSSKYVQADTRHTFTEVKQYLKAGQKVLFSGTGCQIAGLKAYLRKDYENLFTMDLICHGVASPLLFKKYINWLGEKKKSPILDYDFRDKRYGWGLDYMFKYSKKSELKSCTIDPYYYRFLEGFTYRECCFQCHYCNPQRAGDITIGDYWGIEKEHPSFFNNKGISCILINTQKGLTVWAKYSTLFHSLESTFEKVARHNGNLVQPTKREAAIRDFIYDGINTPNWFSNTFAASFRPSLKIKLKSMIPMWCKFLIKKIV